MQIEKDLKKKMVFVGGPRQVGKTTLSFDVLNSMGQKKKEGYVNWDIAEHRELILKGQLPNENFWVFDEIHKYRGWRNLLKGLFDKYRNERQILVTGSARLDFYRYGGDSLQGRYHYFRMHPLSFAELKMSSAKDLRDLLNLGGFPEPFFSGSDIESKRWQREYRTRLIREDILSLERVQDIGSLELLVMRLPELVGAPLSINALREDLQLSHKTLAHWTLILERLYWIFRLAPFGAPKIRAVKKEQKHYHYDWTLISNESYRFENLVASHLLKWVHFEQDAKGRDIDLRYFRDTDGREVDFIVTENGKPLMAIECKWADEEISKNLSYFKVKFPSCEAIQVTAAGGKDYVSPDGIAVMPANKFLTRFV